MSHVLIIESDKILADNMSSAFKRAGHSISWQRDAQSAIDSADKKIPDIVVMDLVLAEHNGVEFLNEMRSYSEWQRIPVIIHSEISPEELSSSSSFSQLGISAYHQKSSTSLIDLVESVASLTPA